MGTVEKQVADRYERQGWTVLSKGWPDLFMYRKHRGRIELKIREVKGPGDKLRREQKIILALLQSAGLNVGTYYTSEDREVAGAGNLTVRWRGPKSSIF